MTPREAWDGRAPEEGWWWLYHPKSRETFPARFWIGGRWYSEHWGGEWDDCIAKRGYTLGPRCVPPTASPLGAREAWDAAIEAAAQWCAQRAHQMAETALDDERSVEIRRRAETQEAAYSHAREAIRSLTQPPEIEAKQTQWQPIETAPRDTKIWVWGDNWHWRHGDAAIFHSDYNGQRDVITRHGVAGPSCRLGSRNAPTHWAPLPAPPEHAP